MTTTDPTRSGGHPAPPAAPSDLPAPPSGPAPGADPTATAPQPAPPGDPLRDFRIVVDIDTTNLVTGPDDGQLPELLNAIHVAVEDYVDADEFDVSATDLDAAPQPAPLDLDAIEDDWLWQCGSCDAGLPMPCTCPPADHRTVIHRLVAEVRRLRAERDEEQAVHAKTISNFEEFAEGTAETAGQLRDARRQVETWRGRALGAEALLHDMGARRDADGTWQPPPAELDAAPAAPTTYALPAEPADGTTVYETATGRDWTRLGKVWRDTEADSRMAWHTLLAVRGPLSTTPPAGTEGER